jgi:hypothetical protein
MGICFPYRFRLAKSASTRWQRKTSVIGLDCGIGPPVPGKLVPEESGTKPSNYSVIGILMLLSRRMSVCCSMCSDESPSSSR